MNDSELVDCDDCEAAAILAVISMRSFLSIIVVAVNCLLTCFVQIE